ncbi:MAG: hypothetical protein HYR55_20145 [Acidobacteria bacterium]|nr:hypothetical protein [Acidobacteriota bacterium]MBI3655308.1 hypothetical protein [Acidobacteriota bacterium]
MNRRQNLLLYAGFLLSIVAFASYFYFVRFPGTRDFPWLNLLLFAVALILLGIGWVRAYRRATEYRGKVSGPVLTALSVVVLGLFLFINFSLTRHLPASAGRLEWDRERRSLHCPTQTELRWRLRAFVERRPEDRGTGGCC